MNENRYIGLGREKTAEALRAMADAVDKGDLRINEIVIGETLSKEKWFKFQGEQFGPILLEGW